jgi:mRNA turnover protein 4
MAKSKRNKVVPLTKVSKKDNVSSKKSKLVESIENKLEEYEFCYVFRFKNMTTMPMQELRNYWSSSSKFVIGKNKVIQVAMGKSEEDEPKLNSHKLSRHLKGNSGLFFSNKDPDMVLE